MGDGCYIFFISSSTNNSVCSSYYGCKQENLSWIQTKYGVLVCPDLISNNLLWGWNFFSHPGCMY